MSIIITFFSENKEFFLKTILIGLHNLGGCVAAQKKELNHNIKLIFQMKFELGKNLGENFGF